ncbi:ClpXP protease specificity-enhancing factor [Ningiella sp. W23]|uniref:ClpXP protease specificity-enhancing factor n=1 Tax=Ningiella sp. W23 TaxID=3023715 RepID=UPI0037573AB3
MTSNQPYMLKAFFDWILDNGLTPYMVIDASIEGCQVPGEFVRDGQIVLNVSPSACVNFYMDLEQISFQARFSGQPMLVQFPCFAVSAIYAKENGAGTVFTAETMGDDEPPKPPSPSPTPNKGKKASLRVIK